MFLNCLYSRKSLNAAWTPSFIVPREWVRMKEGAASVATEVILGLQLCALGLGGEDMFSCLDAAAAVL